MFDPKANFSHLIICLACDPPGPLVSPTTLHCGHTVCSSHVRSGSDNISPDADEPIASSSRVQLPSIISRAVGYTRRHHPQPPRGDNDADSTQVPIVPTCPILACRQAPARASTHINIPLNSPVAYYPPIHPPTDTTHDIITVPDPRIDVSVSRVLHLLDRADDWRERTDREHEGARNSGTELLSRTRRSAVNEDERQGSDEESRSEFDSNDDHSEQEDARQGSLGFDPDPDAPALRRRLPSSRNPHSRPRKRKRPRLVSPTHSPPLISRNLVAPLSQDDDSSRVSGPSASDNVEDRFFKELTEQLTCEICFILLYEPVTTPCQHTFCARCLHRSLDHGSKCPLCRQNLPPFSYFQDHPYNKVLLAILAKGFPEQYMERAQTIEAEERNARLSTPIFVYQLSFPGTPTLLHFYEPRYRLMLRRVLESATPCFGMVMHPRPGAPVGAEFGTMLQIRSVQMLPDGRSIVETWGSWRFRIMERGTLDGYMVARVERIDDVLVELEDEAERSISNTLPSSPGREVRLPSPVVSAPPTSMSSTSTSTLAGSDATTDESDSLPKTSISEMNSSTSIATELSVQATFSARPETRRIAGMQPSNEELLAICHGFLEQLRNGTAPWVVQRLNNTYGPMPSDVSDFSFWMALVLPIDDHEKAKLLPIKSARLRLRLVVHWIEQLNSNWWFSSGCVIS